MKDHKDCAVIKNVNMDNVLDQWQREEFTEILNVMEAQSDDFRRTQIIYLTYCILHGY